MKIIKIIGLAVLGSLIGYPILLFIISKLNVCGSDDLGMCAGLLFALVFIVFIVVITGFIGSKIFERKGKEKKVDESFSQVILKKLFTYLIIFPIVIVLIFFLLDIIQKILTRLDLF